MPRCYLPFATASLHDASVEDKETRPPPRYHEGTLIEAMQNAWRFVTDEALRERPKDAKGIGTPATRAEIIRGLKAQEFLVADGKHIVPTERGLALFAVLQQADPALVDPGGDGADGMPPRSGADRAAGDGGGDRRRLCPGQPHHRPAAGGDAIGRHRRAQGGDAGRSRGSAARAGEEAFRCRPSKLRRERPAKPARKPRTGKRAAAPAGATPEAAPSPGATGGETKLRIPFGNKEVALRLGARYRAGGWYAPPDVDLARFRERGWL